MRRTTAILAVLGLLAGLVSCGSSTSQDAPEKRTHLPQEELRGMQVKSIDLPRDNMTRSYAIPGAEAPRGLNPATGDAWEGLVARRKPHPLAQPGQEAQRGFTPETEGVNRNQFGGLEVPLGDLQRANRLAELKVKLEELEKAKVEPGRVIAGRPLNQDEVDRLRLEILRLERGQGEDLIIIERKRLGWPDRPRGAELWGRQEQRVIPLPLKHTDVKAQVSVYIGAVTVTQQYHNPYASKIEAVYVFPLPDDAAVNEFVMTVGDRKIRGIVREREEARQIYLEARRQGLVASLLEQNRPNIFTQSVANIEPGKKVDISITYFHTIRQADGAFEFAFPMVVGPRYNPAGSSDGVGAAPAGKPGASGQKTEVQYLPPDTVSSADIALEVDVDAGTPIDELKSPTHVVDVKAVTPSRSIVTLGANDRHPNKDFVLRWKLAGKGVRAALATHRDESGGYFTLVLFPPDTLGEIVPVKREMIFVLDCSGSMSGEPLAACKRAMERCLRRLSPDDTFQVIRFSADAKSLFPAPVAATPENVTAALRHVADLNSESSTEMIHGIRAALGYPESGRHRIVSFMTDGYIGNEAEILAEAERRLGGARIFSFGIGSSVNRYLIEGLGRVGRGVAHYVLPGDAGEKAADELYTRLERPAVTDLRIEWGAMQAAEIHPSPLPDLLAGRPVVLAGRFKGDGPATVVVHGKAGGQPWKTELAVDPGQPSLRHRALGAVWARQKIASLHFAAATKAQSVEYAQEIKATALRHGLVSEFTSFLAVDSLSKTQGTHGTTVVQPVPVPAGVRYDTTVEKK